MFPTFTGSSRKTRNVNLSGQKPSNPFAKATGAAGVGSSRTEAIAKAERDRQQRQQERETKEAALRIQKLWRGYRVRRDHRASCRASLAQAYSDSNNGQWGEHGEQRRSEYAVPLILAAFQASRAEDHVLLSRVVEDLLRTNFHVFRTNLVDRNRLEKLARLVLAALESSGADDASQSRSLVFLEALATIYPILPPSITLDLIAYYKVLARLYRQPGLDRTGGALRNAVVAPLKQNSQPAYDAFAFIFLTQRDLPLSELDFLASNIPMACLVATINDRITSHRIDSGQERGLWLLAYLIALRKRQRREEEPGNYFVALNHLLSFFSSQIRASFIARAKGLRETLPAFVSSELASLTDKDEILALVQQLVRHGSGDENLGSFVGYILTLMYCFPGLGDDIRMRLYLADIQTSQCSVPSIKFFWRAISQTAIFSTIVSDSEAALGILRYKNRAGHPRAASDPDWHREWRTILLFLELYVFVLRLTDDDDFFGGINPTALHSASRLRASGLSLTELKALTLFLKHLGFVLYYNAATILDEAAGENCEVAGEFLTSSSRTRNSGGASSKSKSVAETYVLTSGIDYDAFRTLVTTAVKMIYERDSRRPFLPERHWLMTSKFDMEGFLQAVVVEEQEQRALRQAEEDSTDVSSDGDDDYQPTGSRPQESQQTRLVRLKAMRKKAARDRMLAAAGPRIEILRNMPFVVPFETRVQIFRQFILIDKERRRGGYVDPDQWRLSILQQHQPHPAWANPHGPGRDILSRHSARIKRGQIFNDAMDQFWELGDSLKEPIQITFVDEFDIQEAGIDGGGVTKEFLTSVTNEAFTENTNLFVANSKNSLYPNPAALDQHREGLRRAGLHEGSDAWQESIQDFLRQYEFLGRIIGKCMYEGILIDIAFAGFFLLKWASAGGQDTYRANINDLHELDEELYQGMLHLKNYTGDIADLALDFTITDQVSLPGEPVKTITRNLIPNGEDIPVTNENRPLYISYVARHRLSVQPHAQTRAFLRGLGLIIDPAWLSMFNQNELQRLVGGDSSSIDVEDLRRHTLYSGVYQIGTDGQEHPTVKLFWEVMRGLTDAQKRDVLKYVTSTPRAPLLGFSQLKPAFSIRDGGLDQTRLPSASTCVNLLKLPQYRTAEVLRSKLLYAVSSGAGFDLS